MLTVDDCNTILKKYGDVGLWYSLDLGQFDLSGMPRDGRYLSFSHETFIIQFKLDWPDGVERLYVRIGFNNSNCTILQYNSYADGTLHSLQMQSSSAEAFGWFDETSFKEDPPIFNIYMTGNKPNTGVNARIYSLLFIPLQPTIISMVNGEYNDKFYIRLLGDRTRNFIIDGETVSLEEDENGKFLRLPPHNCVLGVRLQGTHYGFYKITFREFKELPIPYIPTLYKGTPQSIQVLNTEDDDPISDYQTYYQGRTLKDNTIHLPYDADDYINIIVDLKDYRYPFCTVKLKAPTTLYQADSQSDVETAIENGIQTLQIGDNETEVTLNAIELSNVTLINSNIQVSESILTDCQIIDSVYTDNGGNTVTSTIFKDTDYTTTAQSNYNEVTFNECTIHDSEINLTGTVNDCTITDTLIISDGVINIQDNTFTGVGAKEYFPSHLYLTGEYTVIGNTFNLTGEWEELSYNMCIIKATNDFNPSQFINNNTLHLNITYQDEPVNTFYYNIVDEDKIRAVRLN